MTLRILDLFCCAGGAAMGYHRAGFEVVGVDIDPQPNYPFEFVRDSAIDIPAEQIAEEFDAIHASPPCQRYSTMTRKWGRSEDHPDLIGPTRELLERTGLPYVIENVEGARSELHNPARICGSGLGMDVRRHRYFESNWPLIGVACNHAWQTPRFPIPDKRKGSLSSVVPVYGHANYAGDVDLWRSTMGIDWMVGDELAESIPPAYTEFIGRQLRAFILAKRGEAVPA